MSLKSLRSKGESSILSRKEAGCCSFYIPKPALTGIIVGRFKMIIKKKTKKSFNPLLAAQWEDKDQSKLLY